jgi:hypothetical protein
VPRSWQRCYHSRHWAERVKLHRASRVTTFGEDPFPEARRVRSSHDPARVLVGIFCQPAADAVWGISDPNRSSGFNGAVQTVKSFSKRSSAEFA